jgi:hypothetical protein
MNSLVIAVIVFACMFGGGVAGLLLKRRLPDHHLSPETRDVVRLAAGLIGTLAALVLGLLIASANSSFNARDQEIKQASADLILLDRALRYYGPETTEIRTLLRQGVARAIELHWPKTRYPGPRIASSIPGPGLSRVEWSSSRPRPAAELRTRHSLVSPPGNPFHKEETYGLSLWSSSPNRPAPP